MLENRINNFCQNTNKTNCSRGEAVKCVEMVYWSYFEVSVARLGGRLRGAMPGRTPRLTSPLIEVDTGD